MYNIHSFHLYIKESLWQIEVHYTLNDTPRFTFDKSLLWNRFFFSHSHYCCVIFLPLKVFNYLSVCDGMRTFISITIIMIIQCNGAYLHYIAQINTILGACTTWNIRCKRILKSFPVKSRMPMTYCSIVKSFLSTFYTEHGSFNAVMCANFQKDLRRTRFRGIWVKMIYLGLTMSIS